jgi:hypothetical protein
MKKPAKGGPTVETLSAEAMQRSCGLPELAGLSPEAPDKLQCKPGLVAYDANAGCSKSLAVMALKVS